MCGAGPLVVPVTGSIGRRAGLDASLEAIPLDPVDGISITTLVDNRVDLVLPDQGASDGSG